MVFRKESREDSFQRQISALRQQLGNDEEEQDLDDADRFQSGPGAHPDQLPDAPAMDRPQMDEFPAERSDASIGIIAANSTWNGTLQSDGSLRIFGQAEGELAAHDEIFVAEGARVHARVSARRVVVAGMIEGTVECSGRLEVLASGRVSGDVTSPSLVVHEGAAVEGDLKMRAPEGA